jgi:hypothetical protein
MGQRKRKKVPKTPDVKIPKWQRRCGEGICCQAKTEDGVQCSREATWKVDMTKGVTFKGYKVMSEMNCCFYCSQHAKMYAARGGMALATVGIKTLIGTQMSYEDYYAAFPDEDPLRK